MKSKLALGPIAALGLTTILAVSALAQRPGYNAELPPIPDTPLPLPPTPARIIGQRMSIPIVAGDTRSRSKEEINLAHEADELARQLGAAKSDSDRDQLKDKLGAVLEKQFDLRQQRHEGEIEALEARVERLKDLVQKRRENRREIVARRLDQILRDAQGLGWEGILDRGPERPGTPFSVPTSVLPTPRPRKGLQGN